MKSTIVLAPDIIRARVKALVSMHFFMKEIDRRPLTADDDPTLNQAIVFAFSRALIRIADWVDSFNIQPLNFYDTPDELLQLEVTLEVDNGATVNLPLIRRALEDYISSSLMNELLADSPQASTYRMRCDDALIEIDTMLTLPAAGSPPRLKRSY